MNKFDVTENRNMYIGGSDIPAIMGISKFKSRFELLQEKAELIVSEFRGNEYTDYGNVMEPKIRDFVNKKRKKKFEENRVIEDGLRYHSDGFNGDTVLEIKTTSRVGNSELEYKDYLVQLLLGMHLNGVKKGVLAVYSRPVDFDEDFDSERLKVFKVDLKTHKELLEDILSAVAKFKIDIEKIKSNPFLTEEDLQPKELIELSNKVVAFERELAEIEPIKKQHENLKKQLKNAMETHGIKKWETPNGIKITLVADGQPTEKEEFNLAKFKEENQELHDKYLETKTKKGRAGYVKITVPAK